MSATLAADQLLTVDAPLPGLSEAVRHVFDRAQALAGLTETTTAAIRTGPGMPAATGQQEAFQQAQKRSDSLARSGQEVIESAREALDAIEQPIA